jgi:hypothetical protein
MTNAPMHEQRIRRLVASHRVEQTENTELQKLTRIDRVF